MRKVVNVVLVVPAGDALAVQDVNGMLEGAGQGSGVLEPLDTNDAGGTELGLLVYACAYVNLNLDAVREAVREAPWEDAESVTLVLDNGDLGYRVCTTAGELRRGSGAPEPNRTGLTLYEYRASKELTARLDVDDQFYALLAALMRQADSTNAPLLRAGWPQVWNDLQARFQSPGGVLASDDPRGAGA